MNCSGLIQSVLSDDNFSKYRIKFPPAKGLDSRLWTGSGYTYSQPDTTSYDYEYPDMSDDTEESGNPFALEEVKDDTPMEEEVELVEEE